MDFIELEVRTALIVHGFDSENREITEEVEDPSFVKKIIARSRILSISEQYVLVSSSHDRVMYWEYKGTMEELKSRMLNSGAVIA
ncbi:MAG: hypothetical protein AAF490_04365 [Chloroflexota bacterium]